MINDEAHSGMKRYIGLRNIVTSKTDWKYLMLYEVDGYEKGKLLSIIATVSHMETSFICYETKHGYHLVGLTPINAQQWGNWFQRLQNVIPEYYSGQTLRLSLKEGEEQKLIHYSFRYPYISRLTDMYCKRFNIDMRDLYYEYRLTKYTSVFEKYWSVKI